MNLLHQNKIIQLIKLNRDCITDHKIDRDDKFKYLGFDILDFTELICTIEKTFNIQIDYSEEIRIKRVEDLFKIIELKLNQNEK